MWVIAVKVGVSLVVAGAMALAADQRRKRKTDQERFRRERERNAGLIATREQEYEALVPRFGRKNSQVRKLVDEIKRLRAELAAARKRAA